MNWKIMIVSHWKVALLLLQLGLLAMAIVSRQVFADPIDSPFPPIKT